MPPESSVHPLRGALAEVVSELRLPAAPEVLDRLLAYLELLQRWNSTYNLTAVRDPQDMLRQHLADCLAVIAPMARQLGETVGEARAPAGGSLRVLDVGSGGGLPGVVLAMMFPRWQVVCVDTVGKKAAFIRQVAVELGLRNLGAEHARVEALKCEPFDVITSRAFASLADFTRLSRAALASKGVWMAMKGKTPADELSALPQDIEVFHVEPLSVPGLNAERCLVWMRWAASNQV
ncbi:MAG: 16S rRNA (guanine(527)-N(7))-methyltransferase RsmG [Burkholderiales bacterium PBB1]|nr:MAG: 16S rRNA (guanine(527)-N(7))-methyltransferase RsmG [Burkholderiales bacterium PBB1]